MFMVGGELNDVREYSKGIKSSKHPPDTANGVSHPRSIQCGRRTGSNNSCSSVTRQRVNSLTRDCEIEIGVLQSPGAQHLFDVAFEPVLGLKIQG